MKFSKQCWINAFCFIGLIGFAYKIIIFNVLYPILKKLYGIEIIQISDAGMIVDLISLAGINIYESRGFNMAKVKKGMGFDKASKNIQDKEGVSKKQADAILASSTRNASAAAKKANPNLKKVKGKGK